MSLTVYTHGCVVHGEIIGMDTSRLQSLNYRIGISDRLFTIDYANLGHHLTLPNGIEAGVPVWNYCGQRKALIISGQIPYLLQESGKFFSKPVLRAFHVCSHRIKEPNIPHS